VPAKHLFEYAVIRLVPCVEREEFLNVGVILYCGAEKFLQTAFELNESRIRALASELDIAEIREHLKGFERVCAGGADAGAIGQLPTSERFRWLTAPRSTIVQTSPVHTGLCSSAADTLSQLLTKLAQ
jgi:hypothetical protein